MSEWLHKNYILALGPGNHELYSFLTNVSTYYDKSGTFIKHIRSRFTRGGSNKNELTKVDVVQVRVN